MISLTRAAFALAAAAAAALGLWRIDALERGVERRAVEIGATPITITLPLGAAGETPAVVVAHGFSGSRPLMRAFATALARAGYVAVSFDFLGHGRHPEPLRGDLEAVDGATAGLLAQLEEVVSFARDIDGADGRVALLGHSMAGDVIARLAVEQQADIAATVAVSAFSPVVEAETPGNLLMVAGEWESPLIDWARRMVRLKAGEDAELGVTYGDPAAHDARRAAVAPNVEHVGVLYSETAHAEAVRWLDAAFGVSRDGRPTDGRGPWLALLIAAVVALGWPLAALLPRPAGGAAAEAGAGLRGRRFLLVAAVPAVLTPLLAVAADARFLPLIVGDYLALHFALYGVLTALGMWLAGARRPPARAVAAALLPAALVALWALWPLGAVLDAYVSEFRPIAGRVPLILALVAGMAPFFLADEWLTRGDAPRFAYPLTKILFLASLGGAVALDLERLFFLIILAPVMGLFFIVYGLFSRWSYGRTRNPFSGGLANAVIVAWAVGVTFPLVSG